MIMYIIILNIVIYKYIIIVNGVYYVYDRVK